MNEEDLLGLIEKDISGRLSDEERKRLEAYLEHDQAARGLHRHMVETRDLLKQVKDLDAPPDLKQRVMASIDPAIYPARRASSLGSVKRFLFAPRLRLAYVFAAGVAVGLLVFSEMATERSRPGDLRSLYGTIGGAGVEGLHELELVSVDQPRVGGTLRLARAGQLVFIESDLASKGPLELRLGFDPAMVHFEGFWSPDTVDASIRSREGRVAVLGGGRGRYLMLVGTPGMEPISVILEVRIADEAVYEHDFMVPGLQ